MGNIYNRFNPFKILVHAEKLAKIAALRSKPWQDWGELPYPIDWHIYPSNVCNHSCSWCMFRQNGEQFDRPEKLSREVLLRLVQDAHRTAASLIHFSGGGEPLLNKYTEEAMELAATFGVATALSTNGSLMSESIAEKVDFIRVSLNAGTKKSHDLVNHSADGHTDWDNILKNIRKSVPKKKKDFGLGFVLDDKNVDDVYDFCKVGADLGVDFVHIRPAFWYDSDRNEKTRDIMKKALEETERARAQFETLSFKIYSITEKFDGFWTPRSYDRCMAILTGICATATADFAVCQDRTDLRFGTEYASGKSFEEIWQSDEHKKLVSEVYAPGGKLETCPRCVWNKRNEIIEEVFVKDTIRLKVV